MNLTGSNIITYLTAPWRGDKGLRNDLEGFAKQLGWYPSDIIEEKNSKSPATGHLFVEHGLNNSAVISFINNKFLYESLNIGKQNNLMKLSYNNLVDLHISVDQQKIYGFHNRFNLNENLLHVSAIEDYEKSLSSNFYSKLLEEKNYRPKLLSIDDSLITTISYWKRIISSEFSNIISNNELSDFFNSIIFVRAIEDQRNKNEDSQSIKTLLSILYSSGEINYTQLLKSFFDSLGIIAPESIIHWNSLILFDKFDKSALTPIIQDFYTNRYGPYDYDFSVMSKHALSRLYEKYVSILTVKESQQLTLYSPVPIEQTNKDTGSFYTPQFIARFFVKYLEQLNPNIYKGNLRILEPAVGSGIFVRTILERIVEKRSDWNLVCDSDPFYNILAIDKNPTACNAARLSLFLLHLVSFGEFPTNDLDIVEDDALDYFLNQSHANEFDLVISNPPFVKYNAQSSDERIKIKSFLKDLSYGKSDLYLAFIKIAIDSLKVGGVGCFVLPNTFLITNSAKEIRKMLSDSCVIRCVVDLSDNKTKIFDEAGVYPILLIFQKSTVRLISKGVKENSLPNAIIAKIQDSIGQGLYEILANNLITTTNYSVYNTSQSFFNSDVWYLLPPTELELKEKLSKYSKIEELFDVRTGFSSGNDDIFLFRKEKIPFGEEELFVPLLSDREMRAYSIPNFVEKYFFYPYINNISLTEEQLMNGFPKTFRILEKNRPVLEERTEVRENKILWWMPNRPRNPKFMMVPKITTPHLVFTPKFGFDNNGIYAISRTPFLVPKDENLEIELFYYFVAILNSSVCFWYMLSHAPKYQNGYAMLEPKYLKNLPVPDPLSQNTSRIKVLQIISLVKERMIAKEFKLILIEKEIDKIVADLFNLSKREKEYLNIE